MTTQIGTAPLLFRREQGSSGRAYLIQYISLILMILTFVVGIFGSASLQKKQQALQIEPKTAVPAKVMIPKAAPIPISDVSYSDTFERADSKLIGGEAAALGQLLTAHDLNARVELNIAAETSSEIGDLSLALARSKVLYQELRRVGVPAAAILIEVTKLPSAEQLRVRLYRSLP